MDTTQTRRQRRLSSMLLNSIEVAMMFNRPTRFKGSVVDVGEEVRQEARPDVI